MKPHQHAFSLVELSIVLVILGLLVGGVLSGQSLIRSAELRAIGSEQGKYYVAMNSFKDKYFGLPGDLPNGYQFWGAPCGTNDADERTGCNGSGYGTIHAYGAEDVRAWRHLAFAGLVEGSYDTTGATILMTGGGPGYSGLVAVEPVMVPRSKFGNSYWLFSDAQFPNCYQCNLGYTTGIVLGLFDINGPFPSPSAKLTLSEAWSIDTKLDDGRAGSGILHGTNNGICIDASATDPYSIAAQGAETSSACILHFIYRQ